MILTKTYGDLPLSVREIAGYARCPVSALPVGYEKDLSAAKRVFQFKVCYEIFDLTVLQNGDLDLGFAVTCSRDLLHNLSGCNKIILFAATAGMGIDLLIRKESLLSPAKAMLLQAIGAAGAEALCDRFCEDMKSITGAQRPRFSPGYGDLPLELQKDIFRELEPQKHIGVSLGANLLMTPSKSVTAIIGFTEE